MTESQRQRLRIFGVSGVLDWLRRRHLDTVRRRTFDDLMASRSDHLLDDVGLVRPEAASEDGAAAKDQRPEFKPWMT